jgi:hypothetical protein
MFPIRTVAESQTVKCQWPVLPRVGNVKGSSKGGEVWVVSSVRRAVAWLSTVRLPRRSRAAAVFQSRGVGCRSVGCVRNAPLLRAALFLFLGRVPGCREDAGSRQVLQVEMRLGLVEFLSRSVGRLQTCTLGGCRRGREGNRQQGKKSLFQARGFGGFRSKPGVRSSTGTADRDPEGCRE